MSLEDDKKLDIYFVCILKDGVEVTHIGILDSSVDEGIQKKYSKYEDVPKFIKEGLALLNMIPTVCGNIPSVGSKLSASSYFIYPKA
jgi:hypothetical protein